MHFLQNHLFLDFAPLLFFGLLLVWALVFYFRNEKKKALAISGVAIFVFIFGISLYNFIFPENIFHLPQPDLSFQENKDEPQSPIYLSKKKKKLIEFISNYFSK